MKIWCELLAPPKSVFLLPPGGFFGLVNKVQITGEFVSLLLRVRFLISKRVGPCISSQEEFKILRLSVKVNCSIRELVEYYGDI